MRKNFWRDYWPQANRLVGHFSLFRSPVPVLGGVAAPPGNWTAALFLLSACYCCYVAAWTPSSTAQGQKRSVLPWSAPWLLKKSTLLEAAVVSSAHEDDDRRISAGPREQYVQQQLPVQPLLLNMDQSLLLEKVEIPARGQVTTHAIYGTLLGSAAAGILSYDVYRCLNVVPWIQQYQNLWLQHEKEYAGSTATKKPILAKPPLATASGPIVIASVELGHGLDGHQGTVHGGILALLVDDFLGHAYEALQVPRAVTANLNIDFRAPVRASSRIHMEAQLMDWQGRKLYFRVQVLDPETKQVYCEATSLFIIPRAAYDTVLELGF